MNKPATKEPSMDEILSSIRQIIADDDASVAQAPVTPKAPPATPAPAVPSPQVARPAAAAPRASEPLTLSPSQMVRPVEPEPQPAETVAEMPDFASMLAGLDETDGTDETSVEQAAPPPLELLDPEDVSFESEPEPAPMAPPPTVMQQAPEPPPRRPAAPVAVAAPMPDPALSSDMADQLLEPATAAAVQGAMSRLSGVGTMAVGGQTVESVIRELLRPMLKDWLDENLPSLVERVVEKEVSRISRGEH